MHFDKQELEYILTVLQVHSYTTARAEQIDSPAVSHKELVQKLQTPLNQYGTTKPRDLSNIPEGTCKAFGLEKDNTHFILSEPVL